jgi:hypothetical protein
MNPALPILAFLIPVVYVFSLPILAAWCNTGQIDQPINANACFVADNRIDKSNSIGKGSISGYILTPQATGAMASVFLPTFALWIYVAYLLNDGLISATLAVTLIFFVLFLTNPIERNPTLHAILVAVFAAGSVIFSIQVFMKTRSKLGHNPTDLAILLSFAGVSLVLFALSGVFRHRGVHVSNFGITWLLESIAFATVLFPLCFWVLKYSRMFARYELVCPDCAGLKNRDLKRINRTIDDLKQQNRLYRWQNLCRSNKVLLPSSKHLYASLKRKREDTEMEVAEALVRVSTSFPRSFLPTPRLKPMSSGGPENEEAC